MADSDEIPESWYSAREIAVRAGVPWSTVLMYAGRYPDVLPSRKAKNGRRWFPPEAVEVVVRLSKTGKGKKCWKRKA
jgi:hypothetical protein